MEIDIAWLIVGAVIGQVYFLVGLGVLERSGWDVFDWARGAAIILGWPVVIPVILFLRWKERRRGV